MQSVRILRQCITHYQRWTQTVPDIPPSLLVQLLRLLLQFVLDGKSQSSQLSLNFFLNHADENITVNRDVRSLNRFLRMGLDISVHCFDTACFLVLAIPEFGKQVDVLQEHPSILGSWSTERENIHVQDPSSALSPAIENVPYPL